MLNEIKVEGTESKLMVSTVTCNLSLSLIDFSYSSPHRLFKSVITLFKIPTPPIRFFSHKLSSPYRINMSVKTGVALC